VTATVGFEEVLVPRADLSYKEVYFQGAVVFIGCRFLFVKNI